jgi:hypothetical protein
MAEEWRSVEALKLLRQCVVCPFCGALVATQAGIDAHVNWHGQMNEYVANVEQRLQSFSDYIIDPQNGLQKRVEDRLDQITEYVIAPETGLESRVAEAITQLRNDATNAITTTNNAVTQLRNDATAAITGLSNRITALENTLGLK